MEMQLRLTCANHGHLLWLGTAAELTTDEWDAILAELQDRGCEACRTEERA